MGTTADKLNKVLESKAAIKQALINKGYSSEEVGDIFSQYGYLIENLPGGEIESALSNARYDYVKDYLLDMIAESYEITKNWVDYSQAKGSNVWFLPELNIEGNLLRQSFSEMDRLILFPFNLSLTFEDSWRMFSNDKRLIFADTTNLNISGTTEYFFNNCISLYKAKVKLSKLNRGRIFEGCTNIEEIENCEEGATNGYCLFRGCQNLKKIIGKPLNLSSSTTLSFCFANCTSLEEVRFVDNTINISLSISDSKNLSHDSLLSLVNACAEVSETQTLTLGSTNLAKLSEEEKAIATNKGWTLA